MLLPVEIDPVFRTIDRHVRKVRGCRGAIACSVHQQWKRG